MIDQYVEKFGKVIQVLNEMNLNIIVVAGQLIVFTDVIEPDDHVTELSVHGHNATFYSEQILTISGVTQIKKNELLVKINDLPIRRSVYHRDIQYIKFLANDSRQ